MSGGTDQSKDVVDEANSNLEESKQTYLVFMITIPGIAIGLVILFFALVCFRKQPILNTSSADNLLKDPSNPSENYLNNSCTQHVNLTGNELKPSSSEWTNSSTIFASINNRALMNQSIYSQPLALNNNIFPQHSDNLKLDAEPSSTWNNTNINSLDKERYENNLHSSVNDNINFSNLVELGNSSPENKGMMTDLKPLLQDPSNLDSEPNWVEVTNKANQTPSHWVYNDIEPDAIAESSSANVGTMMNGGGNIFENPFIRSPFLGIAPSSLSGTYLVDYSLPKDTSGIISSVQSSPLILKRSKELHASPVNSTYHQYSNRSLNQQPKPPSYHSHLSTVSPLRCRSPTALKQKSFNRFVNIPPPTTAPPPAPRANNHLNAKARELMVPSNLVNNRKNIRAGLKMNERYLSPYSPEFCTIVKSQMNGSQSESVNELYSRPPSDHFYFKINDGKTEFI